MGKIVIKEETKKVAVIIEKLAENGQNLKNRTKNRSILQKKDNKF